MELTPRRDMTPSQGFQIPQDAWSEGMKMISGGADIKGNTYGVTPFLSRLFCQLYEVKRIYNFELQEGRTHIHRSYYRLNQVIDKELVNTDLAIYRYLTRGFMIYAHGPPVMDPGDMMKVNVGRTKLAYVFKIKYSSISVEDKKTEKL